MGNEVTTTALAIASSAENVGMIVRKAPESFHKNQLSHDNCLAACQNLIDEINEKGMTDELDQKAAKYLDKTRRTVKVMNDLRSPVTKLFDKVRKEFTDLENDIDPTKAGTVPYQLQTLRNNYAAKKRSEEEARLRAEELRKKQVLAVAKYREDIKDYLKDAFNNLINAEIKRLTDLNNRVTLDTYQEVYERIKSFNPVISSDWNPDTNVVRPHHITVEEAKEIRSSIAKELIDSQFREQYETEIGNYRQELLDKLPSKRVELERAAKAPAEEAAKIEAEIKQREAQEAAKKEAERIAREQEEAKKAEAKKAGNEAANLFDLVKSATPVYQPKAKVTKKIKVLNPNGYMQVLSMWWAKEGCRLTSEDLDKIFKKQISFCEKLANKEGEFINDASTEYVDEIKAK